MEKVQLTVLVIGVSVVLAGLWAYAAWATYELKPSGWWIATVSMLLLLFSAWLTWVHGDLGVMLEQPRDLVERGRPPRALQAQVDARWIEQGCDAAGHSLIREF